MKMDPHDEFIDCSITDLCTSVNPKSHLRVARAMGLMMAAKECWKLPGRQAVALCLERDAKLLLQCTGHEEDFSFVWDDEGVKRRK